MRFHDFFQLAKTSFQNWRNDYAPSMGAALSYYTVFSIAPLLIIVIAVAALIFGQDVAHGAIVEQAGSLIGENGARAIEGMLQSAQKPKQGMVAGILGVLALILGATTVFAELESNLNRIWKVTADKHAGWWYFLRTRLLSFGLVLAIGFLLVVSLVVSAGVHAMLSEVAHADMWRAMLGAAANEIVSFLVLALAFAAILRVLPECPPVFRAAAIGGLAAAGLFVVGKFAIGWYLARFTLASA